MTKYDDLVKRLRLCKCSDLEQIEAADRIEALQAERCVEVRPLEWVDQDTGHLSADSFGLTYEVGRENFEFYWSELSSDEFGDGFEDAIKAAKAAQADYEQLILSAITTRPASEVRAEAHAAAIEAAKGMMGEYHWNRYATIEEGGKLHSPAVFTSHTHQHVTEALDTLHTDASREYLAERDERIKREAREEVLRGVAEALNHAGNEGAASLVTALIEKELNDD